MYIYPVKCPDLDYDPVAVMAAAVAAAAPSAGSTLSTGRDNDNIVVAAGCCWCFLAAGACPFFSYFL